MRRNVSNSKGACPLVSTYEPGIMGTDKGASHLANLQQNPNYSFRTNPLCLILNKILFNFCVKLGHLWNL